jgi:hypothetical protein
MRLLGSHAGAKPVGLLYALFAGVLLSSIASAATSDTWGNARILYFEPFTTAIDPRPALTRKTSRSRQLKFDAYGRRFELALEPNEKLQQARDAASTTSRVNLYRGHLTGINGSWARIATRGSDVHGLVWDGADLYVIEPSDAIRDSLVPPLDASKTRTVLFRLSDTILDAGTAMCSVTDAESTHGGTAYEALTRELNFLKRDLVMMQAGNAGLRIELSAIGDAKFREQFASDAEAIDAMLLRLNNVDGIFDAQLGVEILVPTAQVYDSANDPLPSTTSSTELLDHLGNLRQHTPELQARGLTHLFTGRDLDGTTVGIGYVNSLCRAKFAVALTEIRGRGAWLESLITAHEIGHNFGSVHDGEKQCGYVAQNQFLMSPTVHSTAATFSSCSRDLMATSMASASCITSLPPADLSIASDLGTVRSSAGQAFEWELPVINLGGRAAQQSHIDVLVPPSLVVSDVWVSGGACTSGAGAISCELGDVPGGASRPLHMTLSGDTLGSNSISARISSLSDAPNADADFKPRRRRERQQRRRFLRAFLRPRSPFLKRRASPRTTLNRRRAAHIC